MLLVSCGPAESASCLSSSESLHAQWCRSAERVPSSADLILSDRGGQSTVDSRQRGGGGVISKAWEG
eukprot:COSAG01_NODE_30063_length_623_cov_4.270992_1_plen_66_part_10